MNSLQTSGLKELSDEELRGKLKNVTFNAINSPITTKEKISLGFRVAYIGGLSALLIQALNQLAVDYLFGPNQIFGNIEKDIIHLASSVIGISVGGILISKVRANLESRRFVAVVRGVRNEMIAILKSAQNHQAGKALDVFSNPLLSRDEKELKWYQKWGLRLIRFIANVIRLAFDGQQYKFSSREISLINDAFEVAISEHEKKLKTSLDISAFDVGVVIGATVSLFCWIKLFRLGIPFPEATTSAPSWSIFFLGKAGLLAAITGSVNTVLYQIFFGHEFEFWEYLGESGFTQKAYCWFPKKPEIFTREKLTHSLGRYTIWLIIGVCIYISFQFWKYL